MDPKDSKRCLLHDAAKANHDALRKVKLLVDFKVDPSERNEAGLTLVHVAAWAKPPRIELLQFALDMGVDPNKKDSKGNTALHKVTKNYAERQTPWKASKKAMELLLNHPKIDPNIPNVKQVTPLQNLVRCDILWVACVYIRLVSGDCCFRWPQDVNYPLS